MSDDATTTLSHHDLTEVYYRDRALVGDILAPGQTPNFVAISAWHILGRALSNAELRLLNAILITMMEHGLTPSAIAARSVYMSAPENIQGAVAAGLMAVGSSFVGTVENNARLLARIVAAPPSARVALSTEIVIEHRTRRAFVPGFGHHLHKPDDPRALRLLEIASENEMSGDYCAALNLLAAAVDEQAGKHVTINATGAISALLGEMNVPIDLMRGFCVLGRTSGLVAHVAEEQVRPLGRRIWDLVERAFPYKPDGESHRDG